MKSNPKPWFDIDVLNAIRNLDKHYKIFKQSARETDKGPYIKYVVRGCQRVFVGVMKYFRHILMGHEIFLKIFDGPQNFFLRSIFIISFLS